MKKGLYRFVLPDVGECARTHLLAGDGAPFLERSVYEALHFQPPFDTLPTRDEYKARHRARRYPVKPFERIWPQDVIA